MLFVMVVHFDRVFLSFKLGSSSFISFFDDKRVLPRFRGVD